MISPQRIEYNTFSSEDFDLICQLAFDSDSGETSAFLNRDAIASETYRGDIRRVSSYKYTDVLAPRLTFIDKNFEDFDLDRQRQIMKWLTSKDTPSFLTVYHDDSNVISYEILGAFTEVNTYKLGNGRVVGFQCVFTSVSPFAFSALHTVTKTISNPADNKITINIDTDDSKPVYPRITIKHNGSVVRIPTETTYTSLASMTDKVDNTAYFNGTMYYWKSTSSEGLASFHSSSTNPNLTTTSVKFTNKHTDFLNQSKVLTSTIVKNNNTTETVILDGANRIISSSSVNRVFDSDFVNWNWLPLLDGKNEITVEGNCTVTFEWREPHKVGEF